MLGVGGSGKQSFSKLSSFISGHQSYQIELSKGYSLAKWREDLKNIIFKILVDNQEIDFLFTDNQIKFEEMLEDVNCLLNTGILLKLPFNQEENKIISDAIKQECQQQNLPPNKINMLQVQTKRIKKNIHLVICMSPLNQQFWYRIQQFPALINCTTIDWFLEWPAEALQSVAKDSLDQFQEEVKLSNHVDKFIAFF